jgi:hypothetical protein
MREKIEKLTSRVERQIEWRRNKVAEMDSQSRSQTEIANILHVSVGTINNDISYLREQAKYNIRRYIDEKLPYEYERCVIGLNEIIKEAWDTANTGDRRTKIQALSLAKDAYAMKMELLTNASVVDDAIRFVAANPNSKEPTIRTKATGNYKTEIYQENGIRPINLVNDDIKEQQQLGVESNTTMTSTTNQVF